MVWKGPAQRHKDDIAWYGVTSEWSGVTQVKSGKTKECVDRSGQRTVCDQSGLIIACQCWGGLQLQPVRQWTVIRTVRKESGSG